MLSVLLATNCFTSKVASQDLPPAPDGFTWQKLEEIEAAALLPKGWFFKKERKQNTLAYFITKENIDKEGKYETGLTLQAFKQPQKTTAEELAGAIILGYSERKELQRSWKTSAGVLSGWGYEAKFKAADGKMTIVQGMIISNPKTKTFYFMLFESSEGKWEDALKIGRIIQNVALNEEI
jgi:hypothetical protein